MKIYPKCLKGKESFVSFDGHWLPCCWLPNFGVIYEDSIFGKPEFDLSKNNIEEVVKNALFREFITILLESPENAPYACKKHCGQDSGTTSNHLHKKIRYG